MMPKSPIASTTSAARKIRVSLTLIMKHIVMLRISMRGALTAMRIIIWKAFSMLVTSVVILVTRPAVLKRSMFENENACILSYIASRRLDANPVDATAAVRPAFTPKKRLMKASTSIIPP